MIAEKNTMRLRNRLPGHLSIGSSAVCQSVVMSWVAVCSNLFLTVTADKSAFPSSTD